MRTRPLCATIFGLLLVGVVAYSQEGWKVVYRLDDGTIFSVMRIQHMKHGIRRAWIKFENAPNHAALDALKRRNFGNNATGTISDADLAAYLGKPIDTNIGRFTEKDSLFLYKTMRSTASLMEFDCNQRRSRTLQYTEYFFDDHAESKAHVDSTWEFTNPESTGDSILNYICKH